MILGIKIGTEFLQLEESTSINLVIVNPFFEMEKVICSPYTFEFSIPDDSAGHNRRLLEYNNAIAARSARQEIECTLYLAQNEWMSGTLRVEYDKGKFACHFIQLLDLIERLEDNTLQDIDMGVDIDLTDPLEWNTWYDDMVDKLQDAYAGVKDYVNPVVYNPNLFNNAEQIQALSQFSNSVPTQYIKYVNYWFTEDFSLTPAFSGFFHPLWEMNLSTDFSNDYMMSCAPYVRYTLQKMAAFLGIQLTDYFTAYEDIQRLIIWTNHVFRMYAFSDPVNAKTSVAFYSDSTQRYVLSRYMPFVSLFEFLKALKKTFCLTLFFDYRGKKMTIAVNKDILASDQADDWTGKVIQGYYKGRNEYNGYRMKISYSDDELFEIIKEADGLIDRVTQITNYPVCAPVPSFGGLPPANSYNGYVCLVQDEDVYYLSNGSAWNYFSDNYLDYEVDDAGDDYECNSDSLLKTRGAIRDDAAWDLLKGYSYAYDAISWILPEYWEKYDDNKRIESIRLLFYRGMFPYATHHLAEGDTGSTKYYPYATHNEQDPDGNVVGDFSLQWDTDYGLFKNWWQKYLTFLKNTVPVKYRMKLSITDLLNLDLNRKIVINDPSAGSSITYLISRISVTIGKNLGLAEVELYRL